MSSFDVTAFMAEMDVKMAAPTAIPGWSYMDVSDGTKGLSWGGHSLDVQNPLLANPELHQRCNDRMQLSLKDLKANCKAAKLEITGSKRVLSLRLAFKDLYPDYSPPVRAAAAAAATKKRKGAAKALPSEKKQKKTKQAASSGCKTCGGTDHQRCTKGKCPKHPKYEPPKPRRQRSDSYELPAAFSAAPEGEEDSSAGGGDWSGRPGFRCEICGRRSENVGPRRGFNYEESYCGGCCEM